MLGTDRSKESWRIQELQIGISGTVCGGAQGPLPRKSHAFFISAPFHLLSETASLTDELLIQFDRRFTNSTQDLKLDHVTWSRFMFFSPLHTVLNHSEFFQTKFNCIVYKAQEGLHSVGKAESRTRALVFGRHLFFKIVIMFKSSKIFSFFLATGSWGGSYYIFLTFINAATVMLLVPGLLTSPKQKCVWSPEYRALD